jgi:hypothetical protein
MLSVAMIARAADKPGDEERVTNAAHAADGLAGAADIDFEQMLNSGNRNFLGSITENGGTARAVHASLRQDAGRIVIEMGEIKGKYAEAALLIRELFNTADAEMELVLGVDPIDDDFEAKVAEHRARVAKIRGKLQPLLPSGVTLLEPFAKK